MTKTVWEFPQPQLTIKINEVVWAATAVVADLAGNADDRRRGSYIMIEDHRIERLIAAVNKLL